MRAIGCGSFLSLNPAPPRLTAIWGVELFEKHLIFDPKHIVNITETTSPTAAASGATGRMVRHYRGGLYRTEGPCVLEEGGRSAVAYRSVDPRQAETQWIRPVAEFWEEVGAGVMRFAPVRRVQSSWLSNARESEALTEKGWDDLLAHYDLPGRFYHDRIYLGQMFKRAQSSGLVLSKEQVLAVAFQDVVCLPGAAQKLNKSLSAQMLLSHRDALHKDVNVAVVLQIIGDTATHVATCQESWPILNLALSQTGASPVEFAAGIELLWLESRAAFNDNRKAFDTETLRRLLTLANRGPIFTEDFADLEAPARFNIEALRLDWLAKHGEEG